MRLPTLLILLSLMVAGYLILDPKSSKKVPANTENEISDNKNQFQEKATINLRVDAAFDEGQVFSRPTNVSMVKPEPKLISNKQ